MNPVIYLHAKQQTRVEIYRVLNDAEAKQKAKRRVHQKKQRASAKAAAEGKDDGIVVDPIDSQHPTTIVSDVFKLLQILHASKKICSIFFSPTVPMKGSLAALTLSLNNNMLKTCSVEDSRSSKTHVIELQGHRCDVRSLALSYDNTLLLSTSYNAVKIWNPSIGTCIRTIESIYGLCSSLVPGDRYDIVGPKEGTLTVINVASGSCTEVIQAYDKDKSILSIIPIPDENAWLYKWEGLDYWK